MVVGAVLVAAVITVILLWQKSSTSSSPIAIFLPPPSDVLNTLREQRYVLWQEFLVTLRHLTISILLGATVGTILGLISGWYRWASGLANILQSLYPIPRITWLPMVVLWLGIGEATIVAIGSLSVFFVQFIGTFSGTANVDRRLVEAARNLGGRGLTLMRKVVIPATLPFIVASLRLSLGRAFSTIIVLEMLLGQAGLGGTLWRASRLFRPDLVIALQVVIVVAALVLYGLGNYWERRLFAWREVHHDTRSAEYT